MDIKDSVEYWKAKYEMVEAHRDRLWIKLEKLKKYADGLGKQVYYHKY